MPTPAVTTPVREHLSGKLSDKVSTGPRRLLTQRTSCDAVKGASPMLDKLTSRRKHYRPSHHMAFRRLAPRHGGATPTSTRGLHPPSGSGRQVLKVGRGSTHRQRPPRGGVSFFTSIIYRFDIPNTIITDNDT
jgi:hypothetical protein